MKSKAFVYIVGASSNPDAVECKVPFKIDNNEIFFGPCKKRIRKILKDEYLSKNEPYKLITDDIYLIGLNSLNRNKGRKIIWCGKLLSVMTFEFAYNEYTNKKYDKMRSLKDSPLHVKPIYNKESFIGYQLCSKEHEENNEWIKDIITNHHTKKKSNQIIVNHQEVISNQDDKRKVFDKDACLRLENIFFADIDHNIKGIDINSEILNIFKISQPKKDITKEAIFGINKLGHPYGRGHIEIHDELCDKLIKLIRIGA